MYLFHVDADQFHGKSLLSSLYRVSYFVLARLMSESISRLRSDNIDYGAEVQGYRDVWCFECLA